MVSTNGIRFQPGMSTVRLNPFARTLASGPKPLQVSDNNGEKAGRHYGRSIAIHKLRLSSCNWLKRLQGARRTLDQLSPTSALEQSSQHNLATCQQKVGHFTRIAALGESARHNGNSPMVRTVLPTFHSVSCCGSLHFAKNMAPNNRGLECMYRMQIESIYV